MKCYYEVLSVPIEADEIEIKIAYRKMALKYHPDKNLDSPESAKEQFQLVQQAYEVLSDRQERAWYDKHKEQILRGSNSEYEDNCVDVYQYFTSSCYKGYSDDEFGFYTVYRNVFETLVKEEIEHLDSKSDFDEIPRFGRSDSDYEEVVGPFYGYWMSYTTKKSYVWLDPYNIKEARERRILKLIEKENKKVRQKAKKERNDEIRSLVAFVRKRDKRVQAYTKLLEKKTLENRQKQEDLRKQKLQERQKELNESSTEAEWSKFDNLTSELKQIEKNLVEQFGEKMSDSEEEESFEDNLYCVACNKVFKNAKAFANHESSKKHKENLVKIREDMEADDEIEEEEEETGGEEDDVDGKEEIIEKEAEEILSDAELDSISEEEDIVAEIKVQQKKKNKKNKKIIRTLDPFSHDEKTDNSGNELEKVAANVEVNGSTVDGEKENDFETTNSKKQKKKKKNNASKNSQQPKTPTDAEDEGNVPSAKPAPIPKPTPVPNNIRKTKKQSTSRINVKFVDDDLDVLHFCLTCKSKFDSKNKLFDHLKKTGHSVILPQNVKPTRKGKKAKDLQ